MRSRTACRLGDREVLSGLAGSLMREHACVADVLEFLGEVDKRQLFLPEGYSSLYAYCVQKLGIPEDTAGKRIAAARAALRFPVILEMIADGRLHLTGVVLLAPKLDRENANELLAAAAHRTIAQIQELIAHRFPREDLPTMIRALAPPVQLPAASPVTAIPAANTGLQDSNPVRNQPVAHAPVFVPPPPAPRPRVTPLAPARYALQLTMSQETHDLLRQAQDLLRHMIPNGDAADVLQEVLKLAIPVLERRKFGATRQPRKDSRPSPRNPRHIPANIKREVSRRDGRRCTFVSASGHRCGATGHLEFDHVIPVAKGGKTTAGNLRLLCRAHNQYEAGEVLGHGFMHEKRTRVARAAAEAPGRGAVAAASPPG